MTLPATDQVLVGLRSTVAASFTDAGNDGPWAFAVAWGDGTATQGTAPQQGSTNATHTDFLGTYTVRVTVVDARGASGSASIVVSGL